MAELRHVLSADQFDRDFLAEFMERVAHTETQLTERKGKQRLRRKQRHGLLFNVFYQPSTRTRFSFASAAQYLGMSVSESENAEEFSSAAKGEKTKHTVQVLNGYLPDVIVIRHNQKGELAIAAQHSQVPVINAGDGVGEQPPQALLDLYTIKQQTGRLSDLVVLMGGDLKHGRTIHSLARLLSRYPCIKLRLMSPEELAMPEEVLALLKERGTDVQVCEDGKTAFREANVVYWTRLQNPDKYPHLRSSFVISRDHLSWMRPQAVVLHPMPIDSKSPEIATEVEDDPKMKFIQQAHNGLPARMVLIDWVLHGW